MAVQWAEAERKMIEKGGGWWNRRSLYQWKGMKMSEQESDIQRRKREVVDLERQGAIWTNRSDAYLVGYVSQQRGSEFYTPAIVEIRRRLVVASRASGDAAI
jgi:hypothetical protein